MHSLTYPSWLQNAVKELRRKAEKQNGYNRLSSEATSSLIRLACHRLMQGIIRDDNTSVELMETGGVSLTIHVQGETLVVEAHNNCAVSIVASDGRKYRVAGSTERIARAIIIELL